MTWVYFLKKKSNVLDVFVTFLRFASNSRLKFVPLELPTGEYIIDEMKRFLLIMTLHNKLESQNRKIMPSSK